MHYFAKLTFWAELSAAILLVAAALWLWRGWLIRYRGDYDIIADFAVRELKNPSAWARHAGLIDLLLGVALLAAAVAVLIWPERIQEVALVAVVMIFLAWGPLMTPLEVQELG